MYRSTLNLALMIEEVNSLDFKLDGSMALMANKPSGGIPDKMQFCPELMTALMEIIQLTGLKVIHVMVNKLPPGVEVQRHTDTLKEYNGVKAPKLSRWHLPIKTNPECYWWDEDKGVYFPEQGYWFGPVKYWREHAVGNRGCEDRVHLVVDLA